MIHALCLNIIFYRLQTELHEKYKDSSTLNLDNLMYAEQCVVVTKAALQKGSHKEKRSSPRLQKTTVTNDVPLPPTGQVINLSPAKDVKACSQRKKKGKGERNNITVVDTQGINFIIAFNLHLWYLYFHSLELVDEPSPPRKETRASKAGKLQQSNVEEENRSRNTGLDDIIKLLKVQSER